MCLINCKLLVMPLSPGRQVQLSHQLNIFHSLSCRLCCFIDVCFSCHFTVFCTFGFLFPTANVRVTSGPVNVRPNSSQHFFFFENCCSRHQLSLNLLPIFSSGFLRFSEKSRVSLLHCTVTSRTVAVRRFIRTPVSCWRIEFAFLVRRAIQIRCSGTERIA